MNERTHGVILSNSHGDGVRATERDGNAKLLGDFHDCREDHAVLAHATIERA